MNFQINIIQIIVITSVINGLVYAFLILLKKENATANKFLTLLIVALCFTFTPLLIDPNFFQNFLWLAFLPFSLAYWIGPALYFYIQHLTNPGYIFNKSKLWHFAPFILNYIHSIYHALLPSNPIPYFHVFAELLEFASIISIYIYLILALKQLNSYSQSILNQLSNIEHVHLRWLKNFTYTLLVLFLIVFLYFTIAKIVLHDTYSEKLNWYRESILLIYAITMYWLSIGGYRQSQILNDSINLTSSNQVELNNIDLEKIVSEEKLFIDPELSLRSLSQKTGIPEREISSTLNRKLNKNFYQFINEFRVEEAKIRLKDPKNDHLKIISIAYESGFNSKATFNRLFKKMVGLSPQDFKESN